MFGDTPEQAIRSIVMFDDRHLLSISRFNLDIWDTTTPNTHEEKEGYFGGGDMSISPDGRLLASVDSCYGRPSGAFRILDIQTMSEIARVEEHFSTINSVKFSPTGTHLTTTAEDKTVRIWDLATLSKLATPSQTSVVEPLSASNKQVGCISLSEDGSRLAEIRWDAVALFDIPSSTIIGEAVVEGVKRTEVSPDGRRLITMECHDIYKKVPDLTFQIWEVTESNIECIHVLHHRGSWTRSPMITFSEDSSLFAIVTQEPGVQLFEGIVVIHADTGMVKCRIPVYQREWRNRLGSLTFLSLPSGTPIIASRTYTSARSRGLFRSWNINNGKRVAYSDLAIQSSGGEDNEVEPDVGLAFSSEEEGDGGFVVIPGGRLALRNYETLVLDSSSLEQLDSHRGTQLGQLTPNGVLTFLEFRGDWLWELDKETEQRLCYIPRHLQTKFDMGSTCEPAWKGSHLVLPGEFTGETRVLDIEYLRRHAGPRRRVDFEWEARKSAMHTSAAAL